MHACVRAHMSYMQYLDTHLGKRRTNFHPAPTQLFYQGHAWHNSQVLLDPAIRGAYCIGTTCTIILLEEWEWGGGGSLWSKLSCLCRGTT